MEFVAVDVETANTDCSSICQIGIAKYSNSKLIEEWKTYVDPEGNFNPINTYIHGIDRITVNGAPKINELADVIYNYLDDSITICHTHFDRSAINQAFEKYNLHYPTSIWLDTARVARRTWDKFAWSGYGLANLCRELGYNYKCHDALEDAKAAAYVLLKAIEISGTDLNGWLTKVERRIDSKQKYKIVKRTLNTAGPLYGNNLVFTGTLSVPRRIAEDFAFDLGCNVQKNVNKSTNILVVGIQDIERLAGKKISNKHKKAEDLILKGCDIRIINEKDFQQLVDN